MKSNLPRHLSFADCAGARRMLHHHLYRNILDAGARRLLHYHLNRKISDAVPLPFYCLQGTAEGRSSGRMGDRMGWAIAWDGRSHGMGDRIRWAIVWDGRSHGMGDRMGWAIAGADRGKTRNRVSAVDFRLPTEIVKQSLRQN